MRYAGKAAPFDAKHLERSWGKHEGSVPRVAKAFGYFLLALSLGYMVVVV